MLRKWTGRKTLIAAVLALALVLPLGAPVAHAFDGAGSDSTETSAPAFDLWHWLLQWFGVDQTATNTLTAASSDTETTETTEPTDGSTPIATSGTLPEGTLGLGSGDDSGDGGAGLDPEG